MLCYVMLCYVMLCYVMLCYVMLCYAMFKKCSKNSKISVLSLTRTQAAFNFYRIIIYLFYLDLSFKALR